MTKSKKIDPLRIGVNFHADGTAKVRAWSPTAQTLAARVNDRFTLPLQKAENGYWQATTGKIAPGDRYVFVIDDEKAWPDPASLSQPDGVHGPSQAVNVCAFNWTDGEWQSPPLSDYILYELHTGTFTPAGDFEGIIQKLDYLLDLGITAVELMPVAQFPGKRNWGYDGVFPFAVQNSYGGARGLQKLVDACHKKGLAVVLDVVYNHLGPEGNYLPFFGPYFTGKYKTPWGDALNFDDAWCDGVRDFFIENSLMWFRDFHVDALRLDAVHAIRDFSPKHILQEIKENTAELSKSTGKTYHLIAECDLNDPRFINPIPKGFGLDAQWTDEFHHALRVSAGEPRQGYYSDFKGITDLAKAYRNAYVFDGQYSEQRHKFFGAKTDNPGRQFVVFSQNHDQVGNRMKGERSSMLVSFEMQKLMTAAVLLSPYLPLLFMGEEWSAPSPFQYFVSHTDKQLIEAVRKGRSDEFREFHSGGEAPDPQASETFEQSILPWKFSAEEPHQTMLNYYKALVLLRKTQAALSDPDRKATTTTVDEQAGVLTLFRRGREQDFHCLMNFSAAQLPNAFSEGKKIFDSADVLWNGPGTAADIIQPESIIIYQVSHV